MKLTPSIWIPEGCVLKVKLCYQCTKTFSVNRYPLPRQLLVCSLADNSLNK